MSGLNSPSVEDIVVVDGDALHTVVAIDHCKKQAVLENVVGCPSSAVDFTNLFEDPDDVLGDGDASATGQTHSKVWHLLD